jgi:hypothetical protein
VTTSSSTLTAEALAQRLQEILAALLGEPAADEQHPREAPLTLRGLRPVALEVDAGVMLEHPLARGASPSAARRAQAVQARTTAALFSARRSSALLGAISAGA